MSVMKDIDVIASLTQGFSDLYSGKIDYTNPEKFDPEGEGLENWACVNVTNISMDRRRKGKPRRGTFILQVVCEARTQDNLYACKSLASDIVDLLEHWEPAIKNFRTVGEPVVGYAQLHEARTVDEDSARDSWQRCRVEVEGTVQEV